MSWMILPCLFVYLFIGIVLVACLEKYNDSKTDDLSAALAIAWPFLIFAVFSSFLTYLIKKVRTFL